MFSSPGLMRNFHTLNSTTTSTSTKIGTETISSTSHRRSIGAACVLACTGNQSMASATAMPITDDTAPMISIWASWCLRKALTGAAHDRRNPIARAAGQAARERARRDRSDSAVLSSDGMRPRCRRKALANWAG